MAYALFSTAFGSCAIAWAENGVTAFQLPARTEALTEERMAPRAGARVDENAAPEWVREIVMRIKRHLGGEPQDYSDVRLDWSQVSDFQRAVYRQAQKIRPGATGGYGEIADALGLGPEAARAVGVAMATNPWPLLVPCHRVVSASGKMTGFSAPGGIRTKTRLLALEGAELLSE
jgi:methylated-DNA-[protein]-cysteine S-methyltransferase